MKEPTFPPRLSESSTDGRLVDALEVAKSYEPAEARMQRALARFDAARGSELAPGASVQVGRSMFSLKAGAFVALAMAIGAGWYLRQSNAGTPGPTASVTAPATMLATVDEVATPAATAPVEAKTMHVDELPTATPMAEKLAPRARPTTSASTNTMPASFDDELALVEAARTSLARGDTAGCLSQLDEYDRRVRAGVFEREVAVMRIEALLARGEAARARTLGEAFLTRSPDSPYANRVRSLVTKAAAQQTATP